MTSENYAIIIIKLLTSSLGQKKAELLVKQASGELGLRMEALSYEDAIRVMKKIGEQPGVVGIAATGKLETLRSKKPKSNGSG